MGSGEEQLWTRGRNRYGLAGGIVMALLEKKMAWRENSYGRGTKVIALRENSYSL